MNKKNARFAFVYLGLLAALVFGACNGGGVSTTSACTVDQQTVEGWTTGGIPSDVSGDDDCAFYKFAWHEMVHLVEQQDDGLPLFATWPNDSALFPVTGSPQPWQTRSTPITFRQTRKVGPFLADQVDQAATLSPLVDQAGRIVQYTILTDSLEYTFISDNDLFTAVDFNVVADSLTTNNIGFPSGTIELKLSWQVLETCDLPDSPDPCTPQDTTNYLTVRGVVTHYRPGPDWGNEAVRATLGLAGMHIIQKTPTHPEWIWATFEHVNNAPDTTQLQTGEWQFYNPQCTDPDSLGICNDNWFCTPCPFNFSALDSSLKSEIKSSINGEWTITVVDGDTLVNCVKRPNVFGRKNIALYNPKTCTADPIPTQVTRLDPIGSSVAELNASVQQALGALGGPWTVLQNYELVGVLWHKDGSTDPNNAVEEGTSMLSNTTMETYLQNVTDGSHTGCFVCHEPTFNPAPPSKDSLQINSSGFDYSFIFQQIRNYDTTGTARSVR